jgi:LysM repeat protein
MSTVRLTRRGRAVLFGLCLLLGALLAAVVAPASRAADPGGPPEPAVAVVHPGDTLWSVVSRHLPSRDPYGMIEEIRRLNDLSGHTIHPGQELILPDQR